MPFIGAQPVDIALGGGSIGDDIVDSNHYVDGSIDTAHLGDDQVTEAKIANDAIGLAELKAGTDGEIISWDASGNPVAIGAGTSGHFLKSQGAGSQPVFAAAGGAWNLIGTAVGDNTGTTLTITGLSSTYDLYCIGISDLVPATDAQQCYLRLGDSSGVDSGGSDYMYGIGGHNANATSYSATSATGASFLGLTSSNAASCGSATGEGLHATMWLNSPSDGTIYPAVNGTIHYLGNGGNSYSGFMSGVRNAAIAVDRVAVSFASGNVESGRLSVWGVSHA